MNYRVDISYDGSNFFGFQRQLNVRTVQGEVEKVLSKIFNNNIEINASGRTDRGVHAKKQVFNFYSEKKMDVNKLKYALNCLLPKDILVLYVGIVDDNFHSRYSAKKKIYRYVLTRNDVVFERKYKLYVSKKIDISVMNEYSNLIIGKHDFFSFSNKRKTDISTVREVYYIDIFEEADDLIIEICANSFLYNMVRVIVEFLINVGTGKICDVNISDIINSRNRFYTKGVAPSHALYLYDVIY